MGLKTYLHRRILVKKNLKNPRQKELKNFSDITSVLILVSVELKAELQIWKRYFENLSPHIKKVDIIVFVNDKNANILDDDSQEYLIYPRHLNWLGNIRDRKSIEAYIDFNYDLVIDLNFENIFILNLIFVMSKSHLKVCSESRSNHIEFCDLIIKTDSAETKQKLYIDQIFYYLRQINVNGSK